MAQREAHLQVVVGTQGGGKTYATNEIIKYYPHKQNRPVLIFDVNSEYTDYPTLDYDIGIDSRSKRAKNFQLLKNTKKVVRILGLKKNKQPMSMDEKKETLITIGDYFPRGLVVLEDVNNYERNFDSGQVLSTIVNFRHKGGGAGVDCIAHFQSVQILRGILMANAKYIRMHFTQDDPVKIKNRLSNYTNIQLGYLTVKRNYFKAVQYLYDIGMTIDDYKMVLASKDKALKEKKLRNIDQSIANLAFYNCLIGITSPALYNISEQDLKESLLEYYTHYDKALQKQKDKDAFLSSEFNKYKYFLK